MSRARSASSSHSSCSERSYIAVTHENESAPRQRRNEGRGGDGFSSHSHVPRTLSYTHLHKPLKRVNFRLPHQPKEVNGLLDIHKNRGQVHKGHRQSTVTLYTVPPPGIHGSLRCAGTHRLVSLLPLVPQNGLDNGRGGGKSNAGANQHHRVVRAVVLCRGRVGAVDPKQLLAIRPSVLPQLLGAFLVAAIQLRARRKTTPPHRTTPRQIRKSSARATQRLTPVVPARAQPCMGRATHMERVLLRGVEQLQKALQLFGPPSRVHADVARHDVFLVHVTPR